MRPETKIKTINSDIDGTQIRYMTIGLENNPEHTLVFLHGRAEWIEKYEFLYDDFCKDKNWGFIAMDHRGQGASGGKAAHVETYNHFAKDVSQIINTEIKGKNYSILAHSMGGLISLYGIMKGLFTPDKLVMSGPLLGMPQKPIPRVIGGPLSRKMCDMGFSKTETAFGRHETIPFIFNKLTTDKKKYRFIQSSPYKIPGPTFGWVKASFDATDYIFHDTAIGKVECPTLILVGSREDVVDSKSIVKWVNVARKICDQEIDLIRIADAKHELLFEREACYNKVKEEIHKFI
jgi:lysophospholipase